MTAAITPLYAAAMALLLLTLSIRTLRTRRRLGIGIGDGGDETMLRATRAHANFVEYAPFILLLLFMAELGGTAPWRLHVLCVCLLAGRLLHAFGVSRSPEDYRYRVAGMVLTFAALIGATVSVVIARL